MCHTVALQMLSLLRDKVQFTNPSLQKSTYHDMSRFKMLLHKTLCFVWIKFEFLWVFCVKKQMDWPITTITVSSPKTLFCFCWLLYYDTWRFCVARKKIASKSTQLVLILVQWLGQLLLNLSRSNAAGIWKMDRREYLN